MDILGLADCISLHSNLRTIAVVIKVSYSILTPVEIGVLRTTQDNRFIDHSEHPDQAVPWATLPVIRSALLYPIEPGNSAFQVGVVGTAEPTGGISGIPHKRPSAEC